MAKGLKGNGIAAPPYAGSEYTWDTILHMGGTTAATAVQNATAGTRLFGSYLNSSATSGDERAAYMRLWLSGAGGAGEALRAYCTIQDVAAGASAHGAHISVNFNATGSIVGLAVGARATLQVANAAMSGGTMAAMMAEISSDGSSSDVAGVTKASFIRVVNSGNATGMGKVDLSGQFMDIVGLTAGSGKILHTNTHASTHGLRCSIDGVAYDIMLSNAITP